MSQTLESRIGEFHHTYDRPIDEVIEAVGLLDATGVQGTGVHTFADLKRELQHIKEAISVEHPQKLQGSHESYHDGNAFIAWVEREFSEPFRAEAERIHQLPREGQAWFLDDQMSPDHKKITTAYTTLTQWLVRAWKEGDYLQNLGTEVAQSALPQTPFTSDLGVNLLGRVEAPAIQRE